MSGMNELQNEDPIEAYPLGDGMQAGDERETMRSVRRFTWAMWISVVVLLFLNSGQLVTYVNGFDVGPVEDAVVALSTTWDAQMEKAGVTRVSQSIHETVSMLRSLTWSEVLAEAEKVQAKEAVDFLRGMLVEPQIEAQGVQPARS